MGGCQKYGPFLGILDIIGCRLVINLSKKGTIMLTTTHMRPQSGYKLVTTLSIPLCSRVDLSQNCTVSLNQSITGVISGCKGLYRVIQEDIGLHMVI